jgi:hypothetical protein
MYEYTIVSDIEDVPELAGLGSARESAPTAPGAVVEIVFERAPGLREVRQYEPAVGVRCLVIRTDDNGNTQERGGAVLQVSPFVRVSLDGEGWH